MIDSFFSKKKNNNNDRLIDLYKVNSNILSFLRHIYTVIKVLKSHQVEIFLGKNLMTSAA